MHIHFERSADLHCRRLEVERLPWVDAATNDQRLLQMPNPVGYTWDEVHPAGGPPGWNPLIYGPWEDGRILLTFIPSRMRSVPDRAVTLFYKPVNMPPAPVNPLGLRPVSLQGLLSYYCGPSWVNACPVGERLVGCCSHVATALSLTAVVPTNPAVILSTHHGARLVDRKIPIDMKTEVVAEVS